ncbi:flagellar basal body-associated FliL family protein [Desulfolutivibrio sulfoxidireducens]|uniref:flagellar basal body-associated FliL family protein n=1 Tax=Desulfolutivibrio sulfoxidireducens TaxID=2773299 RepID=UPI00159D1090|nr:flagellar basal body-associated FliL family protein [Desulfolutivibrio sulfoxidireducens]QLA16415.1 flagellar basal body protein FliL [Desulfolutivibrio sulfoxidireducens]QLA19704.1 flagellar basal body protein FliL [Desulfolutivibrio sulfoxidireducens]
MSKKSETKPSPPGSSGSVPGDPEDLQTKAKLDDSELSDELPKALQKVELDLDDAPFLEDEKEEAPPPAPEAPPPPATGLPATVWWKKKIVIFGGAGILLLILGLAAYFLLISKEEALPPPVEETAEEEAPEPEHSPPPAEEKEAVVVLDHFLVEQTNEKGEAFLLSLKFSTVAKSEELEKELKRNAVALRDAVYYYLKNKQLIYLDDKKNAEALKQDLMSVMNQFLGEEQIQNLLIEEYVVK